MRVIKKDTLTGKPLPGAVFQILDAQGDVVTFDILENDRVVKKDCFTTGSDGVAITEGFLYVGAYTLREVEVPQGYIHMDDIPFEVTVNTEMRTLQNIGRIVTVNAENSPTEVLISKKYLAVGNEISSTGAFAGEEVFAFEGEHLGVDMRTDEEKPAGEEKNTGEDDFADEGKPAGEDELTGAHLQVIHVLTGDIVDEWVSGNAPHLIRYLTAGETYVLREIKAPEGYTLAEDLRFTVEGSERAQHITMGNDRTRVNIHKQDAETKISLSGAEFSIYRTSDGDEQVPLSFTLIEGVYVYDIEGGVTNLITNEDGQITIEKLPLDNYYCQETTAPEGYILDNTLHELTVEATSGNVSLVIENEAMLLMPVVIKTGEKVSGTLLPYSLGLGALTILGVVIILQRKENRSSLR